MEVSWNGGSPSHHGFQYKVVVIHDLDDVGVPVWLGNLHIFLVSTGTYDLHTPWAKMK